MVPGFLFPINPGLLEIRSPDCSLNYKLYCNIQESQLNLLHAPMHGMVKSITCEVGDSVAEGTTIVVIEAMKMQNPLFAPMTGKVCILLHCLLRAFLLIEVLR